MRPTVLLNAKVTDAVSCEEVFGPVLVVHKVRDAEHAIELANDSEFGLSAGVWMVSRSFCPFSSTIGTNLPPILFFSTTPKRATVGTNLLAGMTVIVCVTDVRGAG